MCCTAAAVLPGCQSAAAKLPYVSPVLDGQHCATPYICIVVGINILVHQRQLIESREVLQAYTNTACQAAALGVAACAACYVSRGGPEAWCLDRPCLPVIPAALLSITESVGVTVLCPQNTCRLVRVLASIWSAVEQLAPSCWGRPIEQ